MYVRRVLLSSSSVPRCCWCGSWYRTPIRFVLSFYATQALDMRSLLASEAIASVCSMYARQFRTG